MSVKDNSPIASRKSLDPESWVDQYGDALYKYALVRVRKPDVAEEMLQETFLAALHARKRFQGRSSEKTWLIGILKHKIIDHFRQESRKQPINRRDSQDDPMEEIFDRNGNWIDGPNRWSLDPRKSLEQKEFFKVFHHCLLKLPPRLAQVFVLRELDGLETKEICDLLDISNNNLWVMLYRARMKLRRHLELSWFGKTEQENKGVDDIKLSYINQSVP